MNGDLTDEEIAALDARHGLAVCMANVAPVEVDWLWWPYIPFGKLTNLEGDPGQGKSWIAAAIASSLSLGRGLPGERPTPRGTTLIFTAEDGLDDTLRPRLDRLGADVSRIHAYDKALDFSADGGGIAKVEAEVIRLRPLLVIIDPIVAYISGSVDSHKANEVRSVLAPLAELAGRHGCAILLIRHLSKARAGRALHAGGGSVDFTAAARSALLAGSTNSDPKEWAVVHTKSNLAPTGPALGYSIVDGQFGWTSGPCELTAGDLLAADAAPEERAAGTDAEEWLRERLAEGPVPAADAERDAKAAGIKERTLRRARKRLGVESKREGFGGGGAWIWSLPVIGGHTRPHNCVDTYGHVSDEVATYDLVAEVQRELGLPAGVELDEDGLPVDENQWLDEEETRRQTLRALEILEPLRPEVCRQLFGQDVVTVAEVRAERVELWERLDRGRLREVAS